MPEGPVPGVKEDREEALARIEAAVRQLGDHARGCKSREGDP